ncbi:MAG: UbiA prenyltransferase [Microgenomates group bacterium GW2011_GWA2_44_7]|nr:MAG: UbiA prenyltransferase [Microgenomates group bacterium GW2011_GWA2_44_7]KKT78229.1 MAG: UbiA prenyltransferase [Microgenomates group bacterium GW2011_GWB1_44_8]
MSTTPIPLRLIVYLKERFPPIEMGLLAAIFGINISQTRSWGTIVATSVMLFLFLLELRFLDEFKDAAHDIKYYPQRPVPRGLVTLKEVSYLVQSTILAQAIVGILTGLSIYWMMATQLYVFLMFKEFFARDWLRSHFTLYIISHELVTIPLFFFLVSITYEPKLSPDNYNLLLRMILFTTSFFSLEVIRKFRPPEEEVESRDTYTAQYGVRGASILLGFILLLVGLTSFLLTRSALTVIWFAVLLFVFAYLSLRFIRHPHSTVVKRLFPLTVMFVFSALLITAKGGSF